MSMDVSTPDQSSAFAENVNLVVGILGCDAQTARDILKVRFHAISLARNCNLTNK